MCQYLLFYFEGIVNSNKKVRNKRKSKKQIFIELERKMENQRYLTSKL